MDFVKIIFLSFLHSTPLLCAQCINISFGQWSIGVDCTMVVGN